MGLPGASRFLPVMWLSLQAVKGSVKDPFCGTQRVHALLTSFGRVSKLPDVVDTTRRRMFQPPAAKERSEEHTIFDPVRPTQRIQILDILRGWAVFGMLVVNVGYFTSLAQPRPVGADAIAAVVVQILAAGKFWTAFSILFGYGFALQLDRAAGGGIPFVAVYARRLVILLMFGLAHTLLHPLEILHRYALLGFLLIPLRRVSAHALVAVGVVSLLLPVGAAAVGSLGQAVTRSDGPALTTAGAADREQAEAVRIYSTGSLPELMSYNARRFRRVAVDIRVLAPFPYFLFGFYLGRRRLLEAVGSHLTVIRKARWWALGLGLGLQAAPALTVLVPGEPGPSLQAVVRLVLGLGNGLLGLFYASVIVLLAQTPRWARRLDLFAAAGRLALTNYLLQTVIVTTLVYGYGFGLYGRVGTLLSVPIAFAVFGVQVVWSNWWVRRRFRFGPAEWLWRTFTYGQPQPLRHESRSGGA